MIETSATWKTLAATAGTRVQAKATINGVEYTDIEPPTITRALMQNGLEVGNVVSAMCTFTLDTDNVIPKSAEVQIETRLIGGTEDQPVYSEWIPQGTFYISRRVRDPSTALRGFECYDALLKTNAPWSVSGVTWPRQAEDVVDDILTVIGLELDERSIIADYSISEPVEGTTMRDLLSIIAQQNGGNWIVSPNNELRLVPIVDLQGAEEAENVVDVDAVIGNYYVGSVETITGIRYVTETGTAIIGDDTGAVVSVSVAGIIAADLAESLVGMTYRPYMFGTAYYDIAAELGDYITCDDVPNVLYSETVVLGAAMHGDISAPDVAEIDDEYPYVGSSDKTLTLAKAAVNEAVEQLDNDLTQQEIFNRLTDNGAAQGLVLYNGQLYINATYINAGQLNVELINFRDYIPPYRVPNEFDPDSLLSGQIIQDGWIVNQNGHQDIEIISCRNAVPLRGKTLIFTLTSRDHIDGLGGQYGYTDEQGDSWAEFLPDTVPPAYGREDAEGNLDGATDNGEYEQYSDSYYVPDNADWFYLTVNCSGVRNISISEKYSQNFGLRYGNNIGMSYKGLQVGKFVVDRSGNATFNGEARFNGNVSGITPADIGALPDTTVFVSGVKGNAENSYRHGNVNITPANIGALPDTTVFVSGVKGNAENSYRTGNVNLTPANIGAAADSAAMQYRGWYPNGQSMLSLTPGYYRTSPNNLPSETFPSGINAYGTLCVDNAGYTHITYISVLGDFMIWRSNSTAEWYVVQKQGSAPVSSGGTGATNAAGARTNLEITPANIGAVAKSGDTMTGALNFANNTWNKIGDDVQIGDQNSGGHLCIQGITGTTGIHFVQKGGSNAANIDWDGSNFQISQTLILSKAQDASGTADNAPALIVGGTRTQAHLEFDGNEIIAKANGTSGAVLFLNYDGGGQVNVGGGGLYVTGAISTGNAAQTRTNLGVATTVTTFTTSGITSNGNFNTGLKPSQHVIDAIYGPGGVVITPYSNSSDQWWGHCVSPTTGAAYTTNFSVTIRYHSIY